MANKDTGDGHATLGGGRGPAGGNAGSTTPTFGVGIKGTPAGGTAPIFIVAGDSLMAGTPTARFSLVYRLLGNVGTAKNAQPGGYFNHWYLSAGMTMPTPIVTALGGTDTSGALAAVTAIFITPAPDGNVAFANYGVNDAIHGIPLATTLSNVKAIADAYFAARPNSRLIWIPALFNGGQTWKFDSLGRPVGNTANDAQLRAINDGIAGVLKAYPNAVHLSQVYYDVWAVVAQNNQPAPGANVFPMTQEGVHPSALCVSEAGRSIFRQLTAAGALFPSYLQPASQSDFVEGDWYAEVTEFLRGGWTDGRTICSFNRSTSVPLGAAEIAALSGLADGNLEGGGVKATAAAVTLLTPTVYQTPAASFLAVAFLVKFSAIAALRTAFVGLGDSALAVGAGDGLLFGIDQAIDATHFVVRERHAGVDSNIAVNIADTNLHTVLFLSDGGATGVSTGIVQVLVDGVQVTIFNPNANFPTTPAALVAALNALGGFSVISKAIAFYNQT